jgi:hypothetical protein
MTVYLVLYDDVSGHIHGLWERTTSDNGSTFISDGHLTIDSTKVIDGTDGVPSSRVTTNLTDPTFTSTNAGPGVAEVDNATTPTDTQERDSEDTTRDPDWGYS